MELYDCPDYFDKDTQSGLNIVENAALSILSVTTPAGLGSAISTMDWANGLLIRFALLTPEPDYKERPAAGASKGCQATSGKGNEGALSSSHCSLR